MTRNLKVLGLAAAAVLAIMALGASAASAVQFHSEGEPTRLTGTSESSSVFDAGADTITCTAASFTATPSSKTTEDITATFSYAGCTAFSGFVSVTVKPNGCAYTFHANGEVDIVNAPGETCTGIGYKGSFLGVTCEDEIGPQNSLKEVTYTEIGTGTTREVTVTPHVTGIAYVARGSGCSENQGPHVNGNYTSGNVKVTGEKDPGTTHTGIWVQ